MKRVTWLLSVWLFFVTSVDVAAQQATAAGDWAKIAALTPVQELIVETKNNKKAKGKWVSATAVSLTLEQNGTITEFVRDQIKRIYLLKGKPRGRSVLKGMGIGAAAGLAVGLIAYPPGDDANDGIEVLAIPVFAAIGAGAGAGLGALFGKGRQRTLIYSVP